MWTRLALLLALVAAAALAWTTGLAEELEPDALVARLRETGAFGPAVFVLLFSSLQAVGVPGVVFLLTSVAVWPDWAFFLNWAGAVGAGAVGYVFARWIARDWVTAHLPERLHRFDERLAENGLRTVIGIRLVLFLFTPSHWALGISRVDFRPMLVGSIIGFAPPVALWTFLGVQGVSLLEEQPPEVWLAAAAGVGLLVLLWQALQRRRGSADADGD